MRGRTSRQLRNSRRPGLRRVRTTLRTLRGECASMVVHRR